MIRKSSINLNTANSGKLATLDSVMDEALRVVNVFAEALWKAENFSCKFVDFKVETWLSARMQQCLGKQASEMVKSQRKKRKKTLPVLKRNVINLDSRFVTFGPPSGGFDFWTTLTSLGNKIKLVLPGKRHKHFNEFLEDGWRLKEGARLRRNENGFWLDVYFEKALQPKSKGKVVGLDTGYKKLAVLSDGQVAGRGVEALCEKIAKKQQGSLAFKRALTERDNYIRRQVNSLDLSGISTLVVEDLKHMRTGVRKNKRLSKKFMNKFQRWNYSKFLGWLENRCEVVGVQLRRVNPAYTSQTCASCGAQDKRSRKGEMFCCTSCGGSADADFNASQNILSKFLEAGAYSPCTQSE